MIEERSVSGIGHVSAPQVESSDNDLFQLLAMDIALCILKHRPHRVTPSQRFQMGAMFEDELHV